MGCDIHFQIERRLKNKKRPVSYYRMDKKYYPLYADTTEWMAVTDIENMSLTREYNMFAYMANVRSYFDRKENLMPKGLPDDCTDYTKRKVSLFWCKNGIHPLLHKDQVLPYDAFDQILNSYKKPVLFRNEQFDNENIKACLNPDFHSFTWLTYNEYKRCFNSACIGSVNGKKRLVECYMSYYVLLQLLKTYEMNGLYEVRLIVWFDN